MPTFPDQMPSTEPLTAQGDLAAQMVEGIRRFLLKETAASLRQRESLWQRDFSSRKAYEASVAENRDHFRTIIGLIDERIAPKALECMTEVGAGNGFKAFSVRWPVFHRVDGEGLLLVPDAVPLARVVALPDADWSPETLVGFAKGAAPQAQFARRLAENGALVLAMVLIDRAQKWSCNPEISRFTNEPHREFIYRMAYEVGRHIIGYEVAKVLAAVDWFWNADQRLPIGVMGFGEGGLLALYSAAVDSRIDAAVVSGYFQSRQGIWKEPIYRNTWGLLREFGDAEIASLIAPRTLIVEASRGSEGSEPPPPRGSSRDVGAPGRLVTPPPEDVRAEAARTEPFFYKLGAERNFVLTTSGDGHGEPGSNDTIQALFKGLGVPIQLKPPGPEPGTLDMEQQSSDRLHRQFRQLVDFTQTAVQSSERKREKFWSKVDTSSMKAWKETSQPYRTFLWEEVIGRFPDPSEPLRARTSRVYDEPNWVGYEVVLPTWPDVFSYGILLVPKSLQPKERRPVVVCQHGLEGRPHELIKPGPSEGRPYNRFASRLADRGFVVYCPQNPYIGEERFRVLQRLANPIKRSLFSVILGQHQRTLEWLGELPFVDPERIAFYGISYGGKTALRLPPLLERYALSICSADFNEWIWKICRYDAPFSYIYTEEYDVLEFNLGSSFNHSEMANLMAPRPFMVERGHRDGVTVDSWVAYEYAKVRQHYDDLGLPERTRIEFFQGVHEINLVGTFEFLQRFLGWPPDGH